MTKFLSLDRNLFSQLKTAKLHVCLPKDVVPSASQTQWGWGPALGLTICLLPIPCPSLKSAIPSTAPSPPSRPLPGSLRIS